MPSPTPPVTIGPYTIDPPVVLAPMAGITNVAYRQICREFGSPTALYVCEMITARAVVERDPKTLQMIQFGKDEHPRSLQLYSVDPKMMSEAVKFLVGEGLVDHLDQNHGWRNQHIHKDLDWRHDCSSEARLSRMNASGCGGAVVVP